MCRNSKSYLSSENFIIYPYYHFGSQLMLLLDHMRTFLSNHHARRICIAIGHYGHDGRVAYSQLIYAFDFEAGVENSVLSSWVTHATSAHRVIPSVNHLNDNAPDVLFALVCVTLARTELAAGDRPVWHQIL